MGRFNRDDNKFGGDRGGRSSGGRDFKPRGGFGGGRGGDRERPQMHQAVCSDCGNDCEVPFKPNGSKPVFCTNCFSNNRPDDFRGDRRDRDDRGGRRDFGGRDSRPSFGEKRMHKAICDQCNKECEVPFKPTGDKPIFCDACFGKDDSPRNSSIGGSNKNFQVQFDEINAKLDKILKKLAHTVTRDGVKNGEEDVDLIADEPVTPVTKVEKIETQKKPAKKIATSKTTTTEKAVKKTATKTKKPVAKKKTK